VIEVDRPNRQERRRNGKSDELDAIEAARAALSGRASGIAKTADGDVEAIRVLLVARRSARDVRIKYLNQIRHLGFTAPDELRGRLRDVPADQLARTAASLRPGAGTVMHATKLAIRTLGRRVLDLEADARDLDRRIDALVRRVAPGLLDVWRRHEHRGDLVGRRGRQPAPARERSRVRPSVWCRAAAGIVGQGDPPSARPGWEPSSEPCAVADRVHPHEQRRTHPQIRRATRRGRKNDTGGHARLETLRRPLRSGTVMRVPSSGQGAAGSVTSASRERRSVRYSTQSTR
jgi:hypothetical protein